MKQSTGDVCYIMIEEIDVVKNVLHHGVSEAIASTSIAKPVVNSRAEL